MQNVIERAVSTNTATSGSILHENCGSFSTGCASEMDGNSCLSSKVLDAYLLVAATDGNADTISILYLDGANVNATGESGKTALYTASEHNHIEAAKQLLSISTCDLHIPAVNVNYYGVG